MPELHAMSVNDLRFAAQEQGLPYHTVRSMSEAELRAAVAMPGLEPEPERRRMLKSTRGGGPCAYAVGDLVDMRDGTGPWQAGHITLLAPLTVNQSLTDPTKKGFTFDEVRPLQLFRAPALSAADRRDYIFCEVAGVAWFLTSKVVSAIATVYDTDTSVREIMQGLPLVGAGGSTAADLARGGYTQGMKLLPTHYLTMLTNDMVGLHDKALKDWMLHYAFYAGRTRCGVIILAITLEVFAEWAKSKACLGEVQGVPDGRLFVFVRDPNPKSETHGRPFLLGVQVHANTASASVKDGEGFTLYADGGYYVGGLAGGKRHGRGKRTWASGNAYDGEYQADKQHGRGTFTFANGDVYEGVMFEGDFHGRGVKTFADGRPAQDGRWEHDEFMG